MLVRQRSTSMDTSENEEELIAPTFAIENYFSDSVHAAIGFESDDDDDIPLTELFARPTNKTHLPFPTRIPPFNPLLLPAHRTNRQGRPNLHNLRSVQRTPFAFFSMFMPLSLFRIIAVHTNNYAASKDAGNDRPSKATTAQELQCFVGLCLYMGIYSSPRIEDYWDRSCVGPYHRITHCMSLMRFQQLKRFIHVSDHVNDGSKDYFFNKVQPFLDYFSQTVKRMWLPATNVSVDEMMLMCYGRSSETVRLRNKPIGSGYKIWALCDAGYVYDCFPHLNKQPWKSSCSTFKGKLSHISAVVAQLSLSLPRHTSHFHRREKTMYCIFMDNLFSTPALFKHLRENDIAAVGIVRSNASGFPKCLAVRNKKGVKLAWNTIGAALYADSQVLALTWIDNGAVQMLTTKHQVGRDYTIERLRRRPRLTSTNGPSLREVFQGRPTAVLPITAVVDDYNLFMCGVYIADQLRSVYTCHLPSKRTGLPLFFWLLDSCATNSYLLLAALDSQWQNSRRLIIQTLSWILVRQFNPETAQKRNDTDGRCEKFIVPKNIYVTKNRAQNSFMMAAEPGRFPVKVGDDERRACVRCRVVAQKEGMTNKVREKASFRCLNCGHFLCLERTRNCFMQYHKRLLRVSAMKGCFPEENSAKKSILTFK